jgi:hypothetical protein
MKRFFTEKIPDLSGDGNKSCQGIYFLGEDYQLLPLSIITFSSIYVSFG